MSIFRGGLPYGPELNRLDESFPVPSLNEGLTIEHDSIEKVLNIKHGHGRYYGVVNAWIKRQCNQNGIIIIWEPKVGLKVLPPSGVLGYGEKRTIQKARQLGKAVKIFGYVDRDRLDSTGQQRLDHQLLVAGRMKDAVDKAKKELAIELAPVQSLPKRKVTQLTA